MFAVPCLLVVVTDWRDQVFMQQVEPSGVRVIDGEYDYLPSMEPSRVLGQMGWDAAMDKTPLRPTFPLSPFPQRCLLWEAFWARQLACLRPAI